MGMRSNGLGLIPFSTNHFATLAGWFTSERELVQWGGSDLWFPVDDRQLQAMLDEGLTQAPSRWCRMALQGGTLVGHAQLAFDWRNGNARIGRVAISPEHRGRGLAVEMLELILARRFRHRPDRPGGAERLLLEHPGDQGL